ncbi:glycosyltransferase [bacterium AH-315-E09]|nr:glycosyltransferase [bacterium AH-315-E09]
MKKKLMIMSASIGFGHDKAAETIKSKIEEKDMNIQVEIIDFMDIIQPSISKLIKRSYLKMIHTLPSWYSLIYSATKNIKYQNKAIDIANYHMNKKIVELLRKSKPDMILFVNPLPSSIIPSLMKKGRIAIRKATLITDYAMHKGWLNDEIDCYFVGRKELEEGILRASTNKPDIHITGIPVEDKFMMTVSKKDIAWKYELNVETPTILVMGGGLGLGSIKKTIMMIDEIDSPMQTIVLAGRNEKLQKVLSEIEFRDDHAVRILGFCDNVHELMSIADVLISKSGGLTMTEATCKKLPVLIIDPIPGQEVINAKYFDRLGTAKYVDDIKDLKLEIINLIFVNPKRREKMAKMCEEVMQPEAANEISEIIITQIREQ